jgi:peptidyl-tRNA hydrolase
MKLYIVTHSNLNPGLRTAQACHALRLFAEEHPKTDERWYSESNNLVVLEVNNKEELAKLAYDATVLGIDVSLFKEPDLDDELTAIALAPEAKGLLSNLRLALKNVA